jgi:hypothetical protein
LTQTITPSDKTEIPDTIEIVRRMSWPDRSSNSKRNPSANGNVYLPYHQGHHAQPLVSMALD